MEWQQIIGFSKVAQLGSFTNAALATFRTPSALSQQISALERELGCLLFDRMGKHKLQLTAAGERFLQFANNLTVEHDQVVQDIKEMQGIVGPLKIAGLLDTLYYILPNIIQEYSLRFPLVNITILHRPPESIINLVKEGDVDFGIVMESMVPKELLSIKMVRSYPSVILPQGHALSQQASISLEDLAQYPLIVVSKHLRYTSQQLKDKFQNLPSKPHIFMEASSIPLAIKYVELGLGVAIVANWDGLHKHYESNVLIIPVKNIFKKNYVVMILKRNITLSLWKANFIQMLFEKISHNLKRNKEFLNLMKGSNWPMH